MTFRFVKVRHKVPLITIKKNKSAISGAQLVPIGIPTICWYTMPSNCTYVFHEESKRQNRSTEGCSKLKRSVDMTSSGQNGLNIRTKASPKWDRTRCPEEWASHNSVQDQHLYESYFLLLKNTALSEVQRYVFDSLLKHQLTRDNTFALIRSCGNEVYKVEKSKEDTWEPWKLRWPRKSFMDQK